MRSLPVLLASLSLLSACDRLSPKDCDAMAVASLNIELLSDAGEPIEDADLSFTVDGGALQGCEHMGGASYVCGWEVAGELEVFADALGFESGSAQVTVEQGECHVVAQQLTLELAALDCPEEALPSVVVSVEAQDGGLLDALEVAYVPHDEDWDHPEPCDAYGEGSFACGEERAGVLDIWIDHAGYVGQYHEVDVPEGDCGVLTQELAVELVPAG